MDWTLLISLGVLAATGWMLGYRMGLRTAQKNLHTDYHYTCPICGTFVGVDFGKEDGKVVKR